MEGVVVVELSGAEIAATVGYQGAVARHLRQSPIGRLRTFFRGTAARNKYQYAPEGPMTNHIDLQTPQNQHGSQKNAPLR
tara:strand:- start:1345 stop:1584 length:240 start_codon:yes stop_codon:yes gene_type:complete